MNRAVITTAITLGVLLLPLQAVAADRSTVKYSAGHLHKQQQDWQSHREHRREAIPHRAQYNHRVVKTNHRAVKQRVAAYRLKQRHEYRKYAANPREVYIHYYAPGNRRHYHQRGHRAHNHGHKHSHNHNTDHLEWLTMMALLDNIYSDRH